MRALHIIMLLCFDPDMPRFEVPGALRDVFYIINQTLCPLIIVLASRVIMLF
jgi:hypothetical protein